MEWLLGILDPATALNAVLLQRATEKSAAAKYASEAGFNRFQWILAVAGKGTDASLGNFQLYAAACGAWLATSRILGVLAERDQEISRGVQINPLQETQRRTWAVDVQFRWVSELFCRSMASEIESDPEKYCGLELVTQRAVTDLFKWVEAYVDTMDRPADEKPNEQLPMPSTSARPLVDSLSVRSDEYRFGSFEVLVETLDIESFPFVTLDGHVAPVALREATYGVELALLSLARRRLGNDKVRSDLFENAVKRSLSQVIPSGMDIPFKPVFIPIPNSKNKGETDFLVRSSSQHTFVGECKAMSAVQSPSTVIHSFTDHVSKAAKQLKLRMEAIKAGTAVEVDGEIWDAPATNVYGLAVPLHSYGGAVWSHECLPHGDADSQDLAVIPIHHLLAVARAMEDGQDLGEYIRFRKVLFDLSIELRDELDILAAYIFSDGLTIASMIESAPEHGLRVIRAYGVELEVLLSDTMPTSARAWRRRLAKTLI
ncbi:hypothetical protein [Paenarthrobacter nitroguajacolicus]|uniref:hypothetical protein n=1 Tax=Paenarthrobacter nitroguajacolicus TaxID=211146 RepID=UPI00248B8D55|nr:hypothetical protein [Paenarthrobacter nitroguajacolicus]